MRKSYPMTVYWFNTYPQGVNILEDLSPEEWDDIDSILEEKVSQKYDEWDIVKVVVRKARPASIYDIRDDIEYKITVTVEV